MTKALPILRRGHPLATNAALLLFGLITVELCRTGVNEFHHFVHGYSETVFGQLILYLGAISLIERCPTNKWTLPIIFAIALAARLVCIVSPAVSLDRYLSLCLGRQGTGSRESTPFATFPPTAILRFCATARSILTYQSRRLLPTLSIHLSPSFIFLLIARIHASVDIS